MTVRSSPRRAIMVATAVLAGGALLFAATRGWHAYRQPARLAAQLPPEPDLSASPAALREKIAEAQAALRDGPSPLLAVAELARLYQANGFNAAAERCWLVVLDEGGPDARVSYLLAALRGAQNDQTGMATWLERTTREAPDYAPAWLKLAHLHLKSGQPQAAEIAYRRRLALVPGDPYARLGLARLARQQGDTAAARTWAEALVQDTPDFGPGHNLYADLLAAAGDETGAARERNLGGLAERFREADDPWLDELWDRCHDYDQLCVRGMVDLTTKHGDFGQAFFECAIRLRPTRLDAYELLGNAHLDRGQSLPAISVYEEGLRRTGAVPAKYIVSLSRAYLLAEQPTRAVQVARDGLTQIGDEAELHRALGNALLALEQPAAAVEALRAAVTRAPAHAETAYDLAVALLEAQQLDEAVAALQQAYAANPRSPPTLALLGKIEADSGRWETALSYLRPLYEAQPDLPEARTQMARLHLQAGTAAAQRNEPGRAETHFVAGLAIQPDDPDLHMRLGVLRLLQGRAAEAVSLLEFSHLRRPDDGRNAFFLGQAYAAAGRAGEARPMLNLAVLAAETAGDAQTAQASRAFLRNLNALP